jgi:hypothetical protein
MDRNRLQRRFVISMEYWNSILVSQQGKETLAKASLVNRVFWGLRRDFLTYNPIHISMKLVLSPFYADEYNIGICNRLQDITEQGAR